MNALSPSLALAPIAPQVPVEIYRTIVRGEALSRVLTPDTFQAAARTIRNALPPRLEPPRERWWSPRRWARRASIRPLSLHPIPVSIEVRATSRSPIDGAAAKVSAYRFRSRSPSLERAMEATRRLLAAPRAERWEHKGRVTLDELEAALAIHGVYGLLGAVEAQVGSASGLDLGAMTTHDPVRGADRFGTLYTLYFPRQCRVFGLELSLVEC